MGASADRITAADFLTPPELQGFHLAANGAGRIGGLRLELIGGPARTHLGQCYQQVPLRVLPPFHFGPDQPALLYLLNPTAGLLDGDGQLVELAAGPGTRAVVVGQSATRIHPALAGFSTQQWRIEVGDGAVLVLLPGPAIPFRGCRYYQRVAIDLHPNAGLIWGDIWLAGRSHRGPASEQFQFATLVQELQVCRRGLLVYRDRFCWQGPWDQTTAAWHFGAGLACGSLFIGGLRNQEEASGEAARFVTAAGDQSLRWQGNTEEVTAGVVGAALCAAAFLAGGPPGRPWLLDTGDLAPNHWFTQAVRSF